MDFSFHLLVWLNMFWIMAHPVWARFDHSLNLNLFPLLENLFLLHWNPYWNIFIQLWLIKKVFLRLFSRLNSSGSWINLGHWDLNPFFFLFFYIEDWNVFAFLKNKCTLFFFDLEKFFLFGNFFAEYLLTEQESKFVFFDSWSTLIKVDRAYR